jgi:hypothetical protein
MLSKTLQDGLNDVDHNTVTFARVHAEVVARVRW